MGNVLSGLNEQYHHQVDIVNIYNKNVLSLVSYTTNRKIIQLLQLFHHKHVKNQSCVMTTRSSQTSK